MSLQPPRVVATTARRPWLPAAALGVAALLGVLTGLGWTTVHPRHDATSRAAEVVRTYVDAIAANRAEDALAVSAGLAEGDRSLLTDATLATVHETFPMADVHVEPRDATSAEASWTVGGREYRQVIEVTDDEEPRVARPAAQVSFTRAHPQAPVRLLGHALTSPTMLLFPGVYPLGTSSPHLTYGDGHLVVGTDKPRVDTSTLALAPSDSGRKAFDEAVGKALDACLAQQALAPLGCPNRYQSAAGEVVDGSSVRWSATDVPKSFDVAVQSPTQAGADAAARFTLSATTSAGPVTHEVATTMRPRADLTREKLQVTFLPS